MVWFVAAEAAVETDSGDVLPMSGQANVGCKHKPKCEITHEWNIDNTETSARNATQREIMCGLKMLKTPTAATLILLTSEGFAVVEVRSFPKNHKAKPVINNIFLP